MSRYDKDNITRTYNTNDDMNSTQINKYSVRIVADQITNTEENGKKYYLMPLYSEYRLVLNNYDYTRCDAKIYVNNIYVGMWRIDPFSNLTVERPWFEPVNIVDAKFRFTAPYSENVTLKHIINYKSVMQELGTIKVVFIPEKKRETVIDIFSLFSNCNKGITSKQIGGNTTNISYDTISKIPDKNTYHNIKLNYNKTKHPDEIVEIDEKNITVIVLKLLVDERYVRPYITQKDADVIIALNKLPNLDLIPFDRDIEDFYLFNRILKY
jgi:hypothetical protein